MVDQRCSVAPSSHFVPAWQPDPGRGSSPSYDICESLSKSRTATRRGPGNCATTSLVRVLKREGKRNAARAMLAEIYAGTPKASTPPILRTPRGC